MPLNRPKLLLVPLVLLGMSEAACGKDQPLRYEAAPGVQSGSVEIHSSPKLTSIESPEKDGLERGIRVACSTCHGIRDAGAGFPAAASDLKEFHAGLTVQHGTLSCVSCHANRTGGTPMLHLSDGTELGTADTLRLCAQCHGPKYQDYLHGSHGGMNGYWDLSRGSRLRNHCVDCHDPHVPKFQPSRPVLPPKDRSGAPMGGGDPHG